MDHEVNVEELKARVQRFCEERDWDQFHGPKELAIGIVTEAAELLDHFRFLSEEQADEVLVEAETRAEIEAELADVFYFVLRFAQRFGIDLDEALRNKLAKNAERYPVERSRGRKAKAERL